MLVHSAAIRATEAPAEQAARCLASVGGCPDCHLSPTTHPMLTGARAHVAARCARLRLGGRSTRLLPLDGAALPLRAEAGRAAAALRALRRGRGGSPPGPPCADDRAPVPRARPLGLGLERVGRDLLVTVFAGRGRAPRSPCTSGASTAKRSAPRLLAAVDRVRLARGPGARRDAAFADNDADLGGLGELGRLGERRLSAARRCLAASLPFSPETRRGGEPAIVGVRADRRDPDRHRGRGAPARRGARRSRSRLSGPTSSRSSSRPKSACSWARRRPGAARRLHLPFAERARVAVARVARRVGAAPALPPAPDRQRRESSASGCTARGRCRSRSACARGPRPPPPNPARPALDAYPRSRPPRKQAQILPGRRRGGARPGRRRVRAGARAEPGAPRPRADVERLRLFEFQARVREHFERLRELTQRREDQHGAGDVRRPSRRRRRCPQAAAEDTFGRTRLRFTGPVDRGDPRRSTSTRHLPVRRRARGGLDARADVHRSAHRRVPVWRKPAPRAISVMTPVGLGQAPARRHAAAARSGERRGRLVDAALAACRRANTSGRGRPSAPGLPRILIVTAGDAPPRGRGPRYSGEVRWRYAARRGEELPAPPRGASSSSWAAARAGPRGARHAERRGRVALLRPAPVRVAGGGGSTRSSRWPATAPSSAAAGARLHHLDPWSGEARWTVDHREHVAPVGAPLLRPGTVCVVTHGRRADRRGSIRARGDALRPDRVRGDGLVPHGGRCGLHREDSEAGEIVEVGARTTARSGTGVIAGGVEGDRPRRLEPVLPLRRAVRAAERGASWPRDGALLGKVPTDLIRISCGWTTVRRLRRRGERPPRGLRRGPTAAQPRSSNRCGARRRGSRPGFQMVRRHLGATRFLE